MILRPLILCASLVLASASPALAVQCEYRGGDDITARPSSDGGYDIGYALDGFDDPATDDHCEIVVVVDPDYPGDMHAPRAAKCREGFTGPFIEAGATIDDDSKGAIIVILNEVLYRVCR